MFVSLIFKTCLAFVFTLVCLKPISSFLTINIINKFPSLRLPKSPFGTCVVHLMIIEKYYRTLDTAEKFLLDNNNASLWTVSRVKKRFRVVPNPIVGFHEECTITVFSDRVYPFSKKRNWDLMKNSAIYDSFYVYLLRGRYSIFLILRFYCEHPVTGYLGRYPISVFIHYLNCNSREFATKRFPGFVLDQRGNAYKKREKSYSIYSPKETTREGIYIYFFTPEKRIRYMDCTTFQTVSLTIFQITCSQAVYLAQHLSLKLNFILYYHNPENLNHWWVVGEIDSTTTSLDTTISDATYGVSLSSFCLWCIYCLEIPRRSETFTFTAWWAPFQAEVWTSISITLVLSALALVTLSRG